MDPKESDTALGRIAGTFPESIKRKLRDVAKGDDVRIDKQALADSLNDALDDESWYDPQAWQSTVRLRELRELDQMDGEELSASLRKRRARLRIEAALPGVMAAQSARTIVLSYAGSEFPPNSIINLAFGVDRERFVSIFNQFVVPTILDWLMGFAMIFLGILVTASIIPEMLQAGSLHLLLSKPISRTILLISKFVGGCAFVFLCVCQLVVGLWLIAGLRLDIWNLRILWCIPVAVFLFAVFFSVSVLAGLRWRSAILSIGVTCIFGAFVLIIGFIGGYFDTSVRAPDRIAHVTFQGDELFATTRGGPFAGGKLKRFDREQNSFVELFDEEVRPRDLLVSPISIGQGKIATAVIRNGRFNLYGSGSLDLLILDQADNWDSRPCMRLPNGTRRMFVFEDWLIGLNNAGLMATSIPRLMTQYEQDKRDTEADRAASESDQRRADDEQTEASGKDSADGENVSDAESIGVTAWITDLIRMQGGATEDFQVILPEEVSLTDPVQIAINQRRRCLVVYSRGRLLRLDFPDRGALGEAADSSASWKLSLACDLWLEGDDSARTRIAVSGDTVLLARDKEPVRLLDLEQFQPIDEVEVAEDQSVVSAIGIGDDHRFAILTTDGIARVIQTNGTQSQLKALDFSDVTTIQYDPASRRLVIAHHIDSLDFLSYVAESDVGTADSSVRPSLSSWRRVDQMLITPLRTITPQTGELGQTVAALVSGKSSFAMGGGQGGDEEIVRLKIARPVLSCSAFIAVMLTLSCLYFANRDF